MGVESHQLGLMRLVTEVAIVRFVELAKVTTFLHLVFSIGRLI